MIRTTVVLPEEIHKQLKLEAVQRQVTMRALIIEMIRQRYHKTKEVIRKNKQAQTQRKRAVMKMINTAVSLNQGKKHSREDSPSMLINKYLDEAIG